MPRKPKKTASTPSSPNSTTSPAPDAGKTCLSGEEICKIIRVGRLAGVSLLKLGDVEVRFGGQAPGKPLSSASNHAPAAEIAAKTTQIAEEQLRKDELDLKEEQLAEMVVADPAAYEKLMLSGELDTDGAG